MGLGMKIPGFVVCLSVLLLFLPHSAAQAEPFYKLNDSYRVTCTTSSDVVVEFTHDGMTACRLGDDLWVYDKDGVELLHLTFDYLYGIAFGISGDMYVLAQCQYFEVDDDVPYYEGGSCLRRIDLATGNVFATTSVPVQNVHDQQVRVLDDGSLYVFRLGLLSAIEFAHISSDLKVLLDNGSIETGASDIADMVVDRADQTHVWLGGHTRSEEFITTDGTTANTSDSHPVLMKVDIVQRKVLFSTIVGNQPQGEIYTVLASADAVFFGGYTQSLQMPVTSGAIQSIHGSGNLEHPGKDGFFGKVTLSGDIEYLSYLGGSDHDWISDLALDSAGRLVLGGVSRSGELPTTEGLHEEKGYAEHAFIGVVSLDQGVVEYLTYLGGSRDGVAGLAVGESDRLQLMAIGSVYQGNELPVWPVETDSINSGSPRIMRFEREGLWLEDSSNLPRGYRGEHYSAQLVIRGGQGAYTLEMPDEQSIEGIEITAAGEITGIPVNTSYSNYLGGDLLTFRLSDSAGNIGLAMKRLKVAEPFAASWGRDLSAPVEPGDSVKAYLFGTGGYEVYEAEFLEAPEGFSLTRDSRTFRVTGDAPGEGRYPVTVSVKDQLGSEVVLSTELVVRESGGGGVGLLEMLLLLLLSGTAGSRIVFRSR